MLSLVDRNGKPLDGFLRAQELYNLELNADLVVLSACQTGLGKSIEGEGLIGLTRGLDVRGCSACGRKFVERQRSRDRFIDEPLLPRHARGTEKHRQRRSAPHSSKS